MAFIHSFKWYINYSLWLLLQEIAINSTVIFIENVSSIFQITSLTQFVKIYIFIKYLHPKTKIILSHFQRGANVNVDVRSQTLNERREKMFWTKYVSSVCSKSRLRVNRYFNSQPQNKTNSTSQREPTHIKAIQFFLLSFLCCGIAMNWNDIKTVKKADKIHCLDHTSYVTKVSEAWMNMHKRELDEGAWQRKSRSG